ncbi:hypothetical protein D3C77_710200 [compost metagenome]
MRVRRHRNVVQQQAIRFGNQDQHRLDDVGLFQHVDHPFGDTLRVVVTHRTRDGSDARDIRGVGVRDDSFNDGDVVWGGKPDREGHGGTRQ